MYTLRRLTALALAACLFGSGCFWFDGGARIEGSGTEQAEVRDVQGFRGVSLSLPGTLVIEQGTTEGLRVEADDNLLPHIVSAVEEGTLQIRAADGASIRPRVPLRFHLTVADLGSIKVAGSADVEADGLETDVLDVSLAGSGDARLLDLQAETLTLRAAGSGDVRLSGKVRRQDLSLAGSGDVQAADLTSQDAEVRIAGTGSADLYVRERLGVNILGSGSVRYLGSPRVESSILGSGEVVKVQ